MTKKTSFLFSFWKENKVDSEFELDAEELQNRFCDWLWTKQIDWLEYYSTDTILRNFLTAKDGINSTFKESQFSDIVELLEEMIKRKIKTVAL